MTENKFDNVFLKRVLIEKAGISLMVRVIGVSFETYWYKNNIGNTYPIVEKWSIFNGDFFIYKQEYFSINKKDCELI